MPESDYDPGPVTYSFLVVCHICGAEIALSIYVNQDWRRLRKLNPQPGVLVAVTQVCGNPACLAEAIANGWEEFTGDAREP